MKLFLPLLSLALCAAQPASGFMSGLDVLERDHFQQLKGKRVGLITNKTAVDRSGRSAIDVLFASDQLTLVALFGPEHGLRADQPAGAPVDDSKDKKTGLPIYSLYGKTKQPTDEMLRGIDTLVFDIQDVGTRFYTYLATMAMAQEEASKRHIGFVVLDRPNPIGGTVMEGHVLEDPDPKDPTGYFPVPTRHGLTPAEMARLNADVKGLQKPTIIALQGWNREMLFDQTGYDWIAPSPNIKDLDAAIVYPGIGCFEATNISVGRGTDSPFLWFGAPWMDAKKVVKALKAAKIAGMDFAVEKRTPSEEPYAGHACRGVALKVRDRRQVRSLDVFVHAVYALRHQKGFDMRETGSTNVVGANIFQAAFNSKKTPQDLLSEYEISWRRFAQTREKYLLYP